MGKKSKKPERVTSTGEILRNIEKRKRRKRIFFFFIFIIALVAIVCSAVYLGSELRSIQAQVRGTLVIHVIDEDTNNAIGGATIAISGPYDATVQANEQGEYRFKSIPAGTYTVTVTKEGYHVHPETASVEAGETTDHTVRLHTHH